MANLTRRQWLLKVGLAVVDGHFGLSYRDVETRN